MDLTISLFGTARITLAGSDLRMPSLSLSLLAYLVLERGRRHSREKLAELFWPDREVGRARRCLNTTLWRLRRVLEPEEVSPGTYLVSTESSLGFDVASPHRLDVADLEEAAPLASRPLETITRDQALILERAVAAYGGALLEGHYDDWILRRRESFCCLHLACAACLMRLYARQGRHARSLEHGRRILAEDPIREDAHRAVMRAYDAMGLRTESTRQYRICRRELATELQIEPMEETTRLHRRILTGAGPATPHGSRRTEPDSADMARAVRSLERARRELRNALPLLQRYRPEGSDT